MNYKALAVEELSKVSKELPNHNFGGLLYAIMRQLGKTEIKRSDLLQITDQEYYSAIWNMRKEEKED